MSQEQSPQSAFIGAELAPSVAELMHLREVAAGRAQPDLIVRGGQGARAPHRRNSAARRRHCRTSHRRGDAARPFRGKEDHRCQRAVRRPELHRRSHSYRIHDADAGRACPANSAARHDDAAGRRQLHRQCAGRRRARHRRPHRHAAAYLPAGFASGAANAGLGARRRAGRRRRDRSARAMVQRRDARRIQSVRSRRMVGAQAGRRDPLRQAHHRPHRAASRRAVMELSSPAA